jgi:hypothetical protein
MPGEDADRSLRLERHAGGVGIGIEKVRNSVAAFWYCFLFERQEATQLAVKQYRQLF